MPVTSHDDRLRRWWRVVVIVVAGVAAACSSSGADGPAAAPSAVESSPSAPSSTVGASPETPAPSTPTVLDIEVLSTIDHDPSSFTQGLVRTDTGFFESIGLYGQSALLELDSQGAVLRRADVVDDLFAEGLELVDDRLVQLTYQAGTALVYDADSFEEVGRFAYDGEGWGLCRLGDELLMSNGTATLTRRDPVEFATLGTVEVTLDGEPLSELNELECVDGTVWANVWKQDIIAGIDPESGAVHSVVDASGLLDPTTAASADVLNGIAHDPERGTFWLTGKNWPTMFEVRFVAPG
ncbi:MAG: glutaminyl-peptide cyclotransferase [Acidimicrobiia bacterium]|nr:glutaminyl-peptide cyclotransferase [Acidimicrobiia bacterium]